MKEKWNMRVPFLKNNNKNKNSKGGNLDDDRRESVKNGGGEIFIFYFFLLSLLSSIYGNRTVGIHWVKNEKCSTRRGLHMSTKNKGFRLDFN